MFKIKQKSLEELRKFENKKEIRKKILEFLREKKGNGITLDNIVFSLINTKKLGIKIGGHFFLNDLLKNLVKECKIKSIISNGKEFFFIE
ncbi:MAG: hypothetical protein ACTSR8_03890 [Promethearchaeota archaeon]